MTQGFLDQLAKIPENELPKDSSCMICRQDYSYGSDGEPAVRLPCGHHVGMGCISIWLSPVDSKNSCPMCRQVFFDVSNEVDREEYVREVIRRVGQPPEEGRAREENLRTWFRYFVEAAAGQYQETLTRAETVIEFLGKRGITEDLPPEERQYRVANLAMAFRTLAVRDLLLYFEFARDGALPPLERSIIGPLNAEQLEALFQELRRRGAFEAEQHPSPWWTCYHGLTDRQMWLRHREEGESYSTEAGGFWSLMLG